MLSYYENEGDNVRVTWHGGNSTMLHIEEEVPCYNGSSVWLERSVTTLMDFPQSVSELHAQMRAVLNQFWVDESQYMEE